MSGSLAEYAFAKFLAEMGQPHPAAVIRTASVVDLTAIDSAHSFLARLGIGLGYGHPALAARLLADMFPNSEWIWSEFLDKWDADRAGAVSASHLRPSDLLAHPVPRMRETTTIPVQMLEQVQIKAGRYTSLAAGLVWGLLHPEAAMRSLEDDQSSMSQDRDTFGPVPGLESFVAPSPQEWIQNCQDIVLDFERNRGPIGEIPAAFRMEQRIARRLVD